MQFLMARSLAGHDKDRLYVVTAKEDGLLSLCDGRLRPLLKPKRKKDKHVQLIKHIPKEIASLCDDKEEWDDQTIRKVITEYDKRITQKGNE